MRPRVNWLRLRDGLTVVLSALILGVLLHSWFIRGSWREGSRLEEAVETKLEQLQKQVQGHDAAASHQRLSPVEAQLERLRNSTPAEARTQTRQAMERWLVQRAAEGPRGNPGPASRWHHGLLIVMALALLGLGVSRWLPSRP